MKGRIKKKLEKLKHDTHLDEVSLKDWTDSSPSSDSSSGANVETSQSKPLWLLVGGLGALSGIRTLSGLAGLACVHDSLAKRPLVALTGVEMIVDKLPFAPSRTSLLPLLGRVGAGAATGYLAASKKKEKNPLFWAAIGGGSALAAALVTRALRKQLTDTVGLNDKVVAGVEDSVVMRAGGMIVRSAS